MLVLRDGADVLAALEAALDGATEAERDGLVRALEVARGAVAGSEAELRVRWVRSRLAAAGYDGPPDTVSAVRALRAAEPALDCVRPWR